MKGKYDHDHMMTQLASALQQELEKHFNHAKVIDDKYDDKYNYKYDDDHDDHDDHDHDHDNHDNFDNDHKEEDVIDDNDDAKVEPWR